jgi:hypothetical protein
MPHLLGFSATKTKPTVACFRFWRWVLLPFELWNLAQQVTSARRRCNSLSLVCSDRRRNPRRLVGNGNHLPCQFLNLIIEIAGILVALDFQSIFEELNQPVDQPLLPADNVEPAFMAVLFQHFA